MPHPLLIVWRQVDDLGHCHVFIIDVRQVFFIVGILNDALYVAVLSIYSVCRLLISDVVPWTGGSMTGDGALRAGSGVSTKEGSLRRPSLWANLTKAEGAGLSHGSHVS